MHQLIIPNVITESDVRGLRPTDSAFEAAQVMQEMNVAALIVTNDAGKLVGIVTERDLTRRIIAGDKPAKDTTLEQIMTKDPSILSPSATAGEALELMRVRSIRHLPVVDDGRVVGMLSIRDLFFNVKRQLEDSIKETEAYVFGDRYGA